MRYPLSPLLGSVIVAAASLSFGGCGDQREVTYRASDDRGRDEPRVVSAAIATVAESNGQIMVELPIGAKDRITPGQLLRVYAADDSARIKGMLQVTDLYEDDRCLARMIGLMDRSDPLAVGDRAHLVEDLSAFAEAGTVEEAAREEQALLDAVADDQREEFQALREQYTKRLTRQRELHEQQTTRIQAEHQAEIAAILARHERELSRQDQERLADLTALRATLAEEARQALRDDRRQQADTITGLEAERERLRGQIDGLAVRRQEADQRIIALVGELADARRHHEAEIRAEVETRQVLENRIITLRNRLEGGTVTPDPVLSNDPERSETILERLARFEAERDQARAASTNLRDEIATRDEMLTQLRRRLEQAQSELRVLGGQADNRTELTASITQLEDERARLIQTTDALQLERLRAERAYFDLAGRILRMTTDDPLIADLQERLRNALTDSGATVPAGASP